MVYFCLKHSFLSPTFLLEIRQCIAIQLNRLESTITSRFIFFFFFQPSLKIVIIRFFLFYYFYTKGYLHRRCRIFPIIIRIYYLEVFFFFFDFIQRVFLFYVPYPYRECQRGNYRNPIYHSSSLSYSKLKIIHVYSKYTHVFSVLVSYNRIRSFRTL